MLFLNKTDILKAKLAAGIHFGHYIVSYGNRPNDYESTSSCTYNGCPSPSGHTETILVDLKKKFNQIHKEHSPETRPFYCHFTTVTVSDVVLIARSWLNLISISQDTKATSLILADGKRV